MSRPQILLVDDDATQLKLTSLRLRQAGYDVETASGSGEALERVRSHRPDAVLSDVLMGDVDGFMLCRMLRDDPSLASVPIILLSSHYQDDPDQELARRVGAAALVPRTPDFDRELDALRVSLRTKTRASTTSGNELYDQHLKTTANQISRLLGQARSAEERYRTLFDNASDAIGVVTTEGIILEVNERWRDLTGIAPADMIGRHVRDFAAPGHEVENSAGYASSVAEGGANRNAVPIRRVDGEIIYMDFSSTIVEVDGKTLVFTIGRDVTRAVLDARALAAAEAKYRTLIERLPDVIWTATADGTIVYMTPNAFDVLGVPADEMCARTVGAHAVAIHPDDREAVRSGYADYLAGRSAQFDVEYRRAKGDGWIWVHNRSIGTYDRAGVRYIEGMMSDITERKQLEDSLRMAQKMEAIGQLTGGIAHDFNNLLAAILGNTHFLLEELAEHDPRHADALEIKAAAERAAGLTRQLLAFSRRQVLDPTTVELDSVIAGLEKMLRRLIGEDIEFSVTPGDEAASVRVDVGQLEQVIMNLVVNARDAMPTGGALTIATSNVDLDGEALIGGVAVAAGSYAVIAVADNGCGMDAATRRRIFEPFFTTKELGKGTGLGLSTCYGIVKQSGGYIFADSEPGRGTTFEIYLPRLDAVADVKPRKQATLDVNGSETILLVEDDDRVRAAVARMLGNRGYRVLVARDGLDAIAIADRQPSAIDLVVTDVIMPGVCGPDVVEHVRRRSPGARGLFMSGYTDHAILRSTALQGDIEFLQKPFGPSALARKVREVLDA